MKPKRFKFDFLKIAIWILSALLPFLNFVNNKKCEQKEQIEEEKARRKMKQEIKQEIMNDLLK